MRPGVQVRPALPEDLDGLVDLCLEARAEAAVGAQLCSNDAERLRHQLGTLLTVPGGHAMVGLLDGELAGLVLARVVGPSPFTAEASVHVEALFVRGGRRRRGLGHALLAGAAQIAEESGAGQVIAVPLPGSRGVQRFLARLGFAPAAAHRVVSTEVLQRRLAAAEEVAQEPRRASISMQVKRAVASRRESESTTTIS